MKTMSKTKMNSIDYRKLDRDSYSTLKMFYEAPLKYYKKYILKEPIEDDETDAKVLGSLIDTLLLSPEEYDIKFVESNTSEIIKGKTHMGDFALNLWSLTKDCLNIDGEVTRNFTELAEEAYTLTKFDETGEVIKFKTKTLAAVIQDFIDSKEEEWYKLKRCGKTIISMKQKERAERVIERLKTDDNTYELFYNDNSDIEVLDQTPIEFDLYGLPFKSMPDRVFLNKKKKLLIPFDLKVGWNILNFDYTYLDRKYYIQAAAYDKALEAKFPDYDRAPMQFLTPDSGNYLRPLIYETNDEDIDKALNGFSVRGREYKGVKQLAEELLWSRENNVWTISKMDSDNNGRRVLKIDYD